jgi:hypothetical protein
LVHGGQTDRKGCTAQGGANDFRIAVFDGVVDGGNPLLGRITIA